MNLNDYSYDLPQEKIALFPPKIRGNSKLLVLHKSRSIIEHHKYSNLIDYLLPGDTVVLNNTKVFKARLIVSNKNKTREFLLLEKHSNNQSTHSWKALYKGSVKEKEEYYIDSQLIKVEKIIDNGIAVISSTDSLLSIANKCGLVPLPPYMHRESTGLDMQRYQTEFASNVGSVAAPTASLNFSGQLIKSLKKKHINVVYITLHIGLGTFMPIRTNNLKNHKMHSEYFEIPRDTIKALQRTNPDNKIVAIGTTVTRALEYAQAEVLNTTAKDIHGEADIFIYPGYKFKIVDAILTNFHAPKSTVLMMASAFAGWDKLKHAYDAALSNDYKFLSYGDSMLII